MSAQFALESWHVGWSPGESACPFDLHRFISSQPVSGPLCSSNLAFSWSLEAAPRCVSKACAWPENACDCQTLSRSAGPRWESKLLLNLQRPKWASTCFSTWIIHRYRGHAWISRFPSYALRRVCSGWRNASGLARTWLCFDHVQLASTAPLLRQRQKFWPTSLSHWSAYHSKVSFSWKWYYLYRNSSSYVSHL